MSPVTQFIDKINNIPGEPAKGKFFAFIALGGLMLGQGKSQDDIIRVLSGLYEEAVEDYKIRTGCGCGKMKPGDE